MLNRSDFTSSWVVGYCYTINSILGAGVLAIPWAYYTSGWLLGLISQFLAMSISTCASFLFLSSWSRVEILASLQDSQLNFEKVKFSELFTRPKDSLLKFDTDQIDISEMKPCITTRKLDLYEIVSMSLGKSWSNALLAFYTLGNLPTLAGYISVFAISFSSNVPLLGYSCDIYDDSGYSEYEGDCRVLYLSYLLFFAIFVGILSFFQLKDMLWFQVPVTIVRGVVLLIILATSLAGVFTNTDLEGESDPDISPELFKSKYIGRVSFIVIFSALFEEMIPETIGFENYKAKEIKKVIMFTIISFFSIYILIGITLSFSVEDPDQMITLNWRNYSAGYPIEEKPWWTYLISYIIVLFPAIDIASSFVLLTTSFADNLRSAIYGKIDKDYSSQEAYKYKMIVVAPAIALSFFAIKLGNIFEFAGIFSLITSGIIIPVAALATEKLVPNKSEYDFSDNFIVSIVLICVSTSTLILCSVFKLLEYS